MGFCQEATTGVCQEAITTITGVRQEGTMGGHLVGITCPVMTATTTMTLHMEITPLETAS